MDKLAETFAKLSEQYGSKVVDAAVGAARIEGYSSLISSVIWFIVAGTALWIGRRLWRNAEESDYEAERVVFGYVACGATFICVCAGLWICINPWVWTAIYQPELYLAKRAFNL